MGTPFKMKGFSGFGNSPMKQDTGKKLLKEKKTQKFRLSSATDRKTGKTTYFKISGGSSSDGGKTFTPTGKTKISEATSNSMKGK